MLQLQARTSILGLDYDSDNMINKVYWCGHLNIIGPLTPKGVALLGNVSRRGGLGGPSCSGFAQ